MKKEKLMIIMFFSLITVLPLSYFFIDDYVDTNNYENRPLYQFPSNSDNLRDFFTDFENYFNDRLPYKNQFTKLNAILNYKIFNFIESDNVLLGKNNWLFYKSKNDGDSLGDYQGTNHYTNEELELINDVLTSYKKNLEKNNIEFILFIAPNKEQVYSAFMPEDIQVIDDMSKVDILVEYLKENSSLKVVYPKNEIEEASKKNLTYYKTDTHWNNYGGFIGAHSLLKEIIKIEEQDELNNIELSFNKNIYQGDLSKMVRLETVLYDNNVPIIKGYRDDVIVESIYTSEDTYTHHFISNSKNKRKIMVIRDSFGTAMFEPISKSFSESLFIHRNVYNQEIIEEYQPDIVVYETVERYIDHIFNLK